VRRLLIDTNIYTHALKGDPETVAVLRQAEEIAFCAATIGEPLRLSENTHLLRYSHPSSLRRTTMYASFLGISKALHLDVFHQPLRSRVFESLAIGF
jgi:predicted nucleic acid-binding protein